MYLREMSDSNLTELQDINWGAFHKSDDHIVPRRNVELLDQPSLSSDAHMNPQHDVKNDFGQNMCTRSSAIKTDFCKGEDPYYFPMANDNLSMLQGSQSHASNMLVPTFCDFDRTTNGSTLPSQDVSILDYCVSEANNIDAKNKMVYPTTASLDDGNSCQSSCNGMASDVNDLACLEKQQKGNEYELAYYDWPDMGNFDDIDKMLRNWDSTIGQGKTSNADELSWFSSTSNTLYASEIATESAFPSSESDFGALHAKLESPSTDVNCSPRNMQATTGNHNQPNLSGYADWSKTDASSKANLAVREKSSNGGDERKCIGPMQSRIDLSLNQSVALDAKIESNRSSGDKGIKISTDQMPLDSNFPATKNHSSLQYQHQKHILGSSYSSSRYMHNLDPYSQFKFNPSTHQVPSAQITPSVEFDKVTNLPSSYQVSDHFLSNHGQCLERFQDQLFVPQAMALVQNTENLYQRRQTLGTRAANIANHKETLETRNDNEMQDVGLEIPGLLETSAMTSVSSENISEKVTSFRHLQNVMHQLDTKTKLCIRDSLYRLARSASQRNGFPTQICREGTTESKGNGTAASKRSEKLMDAETYTNPIDRSIAHLLFHKPAVQQKSTRSCDDTRALNSIIMEMTPEQFDNQGIFSDCSDMDTDLP